MVEDAEPGHPFDHRSSAWWVPDPCRDRDLHAARRAPATSPPNASDLRVPAANGSPPTTRYPT
ncbi:MAG: hypothetical protein EA387_10850 [Nitriliruptor sp.]|nr:MAG: hypothetical protein EA387_10850 [Nitriliruptor sp.]